MVNLVHGAPPLAFRVTPRRSEAQGQVGRSGIMKVPGKVLTARNLPDSKGLHDLTRTGQVFRLITHGGVFLVSEEENGFLFYSEKP